MRLQPPSANEDPEKVPPSTEEFQLSDADVEKQLRHLYPDAFVFKISDLQWAVCSPNDETKRLDQLAEYITAIEQVKNRSQENSELDLILGLSVHKIIENAIGGKNQSFKLREFADAIDAYHSGFRDFSIQDQAILHLLIAGQIRYLQHCGGSFSKKDLVQLTELLWARSRLRGQGIEDNLENDDPKIEHELKIIRALNKNWPRIFRIVGLKKNVVKDGKRGRKPKKL